MQVEIWSDVVCPWCYIGKRHLEAALADFEHADEVEVVWRSFELDPAAPGVREGRYVERLARKYRTSVEGAQGMVDRMTAAGAQAGLDLRFDLVRSGNTFDAHRLIHLAAARGIQDRVEERLLAATFTEGEPIADHAALARLGVEAGLDPDEVTEVLASGAFADEVRADERRATEIDVTGVPYFLIDGRGIGGAQPPETLLRVLRRAWEARVS
ncbi:MAG TPA: DsbA family oxidoreductase [Acidimicrobiales bacterium]|nr:DsbA family oxidoreductase [Acidimicrobiales bacterium]